MDGYELVTVLAVLGVMVWYLARLTRVGDALAEQEKRHLDDEVAFLEQVANYVHAVVLPELVTRRALKIEDERAIEHTKLVDALAARVAALRGPE